MSTTREGLWFPLAAFLEECRLLGRPLDGPRLDVLLGNRLLPVRGDGEGRRLPAFAIVSLVCVTRSDVADGFARAADVAGRLDGVMEGDGWAVEGLRRRIDELLVDFGVLGGLAPMLALTSDAVLATLRGDARLHWRLIGLRAWIDGLSADAAPPPPADAPAEASSRVEAVPPAGDGPARTEASFNALRGRAEKARGASEKAALLLQAAALAEEGLGDDIRAWATLMDALAETDEPVLVLDRLVPLARRTGRERETLLVLQRLHGSAPVERRGALEMGLRTLSGMLPAQPEGRQSDGQGSAEPVRSSPERGATNPGLPRGEMGKPREGTDPGLPRGGARGASPGPGESDGGSPRRTGSGGFQRVASVSRRDEASLGSQPGASGGDPEATISGMRAPERDAAAEVGDGGPDTVERGDDGVVAASEASEPAQLGESTRADSVDSAQADDAEAIGPGGHPARVDPLATVAGQGQASVAGDEGTAESMASGGASADASADGGPIIADDAVLRLAQALELLENGDLVHAEELLLSIFELGGAERIASGKLLADLYNGMERPEDEAAVLAALIPDADDPRGRVVLTTRLGHLYEFVLDDVEAAASAYRSAVVGGWADESVLIELERILETTGDWTQLWGIYETWVDLHDEPGVVSGIFRRMIAIARDHLGDPVRALHAAHRHVDWVGDDPAALLELWDAARGCGDDATLVEAGERWLAAGGGGRARVLELIDAMLRLWEPDHRDEGIDHALQILERATRSGDAVLLERYVGLAEANERWGDLAVALERQFDAEQADATVGRLAELEGRLQNARERAGVA